MRAAAVGLRPAKHSLNAQSLILGIESRFLARKNVKIFVFIALFVANVCAQVSSSGQIAPNGKQQVMWEKLGSTLA